MPGRIQMFIWNGPNPDIDGDFDAEVVLHEYAHGLSTRLVGGGVGIGTLQAAGMGEGWSDFYALSLLSEPDGEPLGSFGDWSIFCLYKTLPVPNGALLVQNAMPLGGLDRL